MTEADHFLSRYVADEYRTWTHVHHAPTSLEAEAAILAFEAQYFAEDVFSDLSRPGDTPDFDRAAFADLLSTRRPRTVSCVQEHAPGVYRAVLGSSIAGTGGKFTLIQIEREREPDGQLRITAQYLTDFDGWYSHASGKHLGDRLPDPCPEKH